MHVADLVTYATQHNVLQFRLLEDDQILAVESSWPTRLLMKAERDKVMRGAAE
jgi:hypothetical protein